MRKSDETGEGGSLSRSEAGQVSGDTQDQVAPSQPIGAKETKRRSRRTDIAAMPTIAPSAGEPIGEAAKPSRRRKATLAAIPSRPTLSVATIVTDLVHLQRQRKFCIVSQSRCDRSIESFIASAIGFRLDATEVARKAVFAEAKQFRLRVERGGDGQVIADIHEGVALASLVSLVPMVELSAQARALWDDKRNQAEREMERLAKLLPIWPFVEAVKGLGPKGIAIIVAEAGMPLGDYRTVSGLWKRMGLAVIDGRRQRKVADRDGAERHGYSPMRRSQIWAVCSDSLFRAQWRGADEEAGLSARPIGPYGEVYANRRAVTDPRTDATADLPATDPAKWSKGRCHNDARRIMTKALLRDLWREWRRVEGKEFY